MVTNLRIDLPKLANIRRKISILVSPSESSDAGEAEPVFYSHKGQRPHFYILLAAGGNVFIHHGTGPRKFGGPIFSPSHAHTPLSGSSLFSPATYVYARPFVSPPPPSPFARTHTLANLSRFSGTSKGADRQSNGMGAQTDRRADRRRDPLSVQWTVSRNIYPSI